MSNIKSTKRNGAVFLAAVLVAGIFAAISPSFIIGVNAQHETKYGMDTGYNSYEPDYGMDKRYNSYSSQYHQEYKNKNNYNKKSIKRTIIIIHQYLILKVVNKIIVIR